MTPSHAELCDRWFLRTVPDGCTPMVHFHDAEPAHYASGHWHRVVGRKFDVIRDAIAAGDGPLFIMSDVDVRFYRSIAEDLRRRVEGFDVLFQNNRPSVPESADNICSGFMVIRATPASAAFFERARAVLEAAGDPAIGDQRACVEVLCSAAGMLRWGFLPVTYWSPGDPRGRWEPGMSLHPPVGLLLHHANHTVGIATRWRSFRPSKRS